MVVCLCTTISPRALFIPFFRKTFVSRVSDNAIFLGFSWISGALTEERYSRKKRKGTRKRRKKNRAVACGKTPTTERTIYDVSPRNTLISDVSHRSSYTIAYRGHAEISHENTSRREDSAACQGKCSKADVNPGWFATDIWNATDAVDWHHRENKLERNRSRRYRDRTNGEIRKNSLERILMAIILSPPRSFIYALLSIIDSQIVGDRTNTLSTNRCNNANKIWIKKTFLNNKLKFAIEV